MTKGMKTVSIISLDVEETNLLNLPKSNFMHKYYLQPNIQLLPFILHISLLVYKVDPRGRHTKVSGNQRDSPNKPQNLPRFTL